MRLGSVLGACMKLNELLKKQQRLKLKIRDLRTEKRRARAEDQQSIEQELNALKAEADRVGNWIEKKQQAQKFKQTNVNRKLDTHRKIVLGGTVLKAVREGLLTTDQLRWFVEQMAERDQELFPNEWIMKLGGEDDGMEQ